MNIQERLTAFAMLGATWVLWLLVILSVVGLAIGLERLYFLASTREDIQKLKASLLSLLATGDVDGARSLLSASRSFEAKVANAGLAAAGQPAAVAEELMQAESQLARLTMEKNLAFLGTVGNNAPFVGLLGTVIGIIRAFAALESSAGQVSATLMTEIGEALVATAIGILVALPSVAAYNGFQRMIRARIGQADALSHDVLAYLKSNRSAGVAYRDVAGEKPSTKSAA
ncbi:MAG: MotA/TolQ/ExbB proton channel family protein [Sandaracinaceae bacterium]|nr:MotA/TolQ/ExbB proton channel family protein [Sandaracinaceae bacterium]